MTTSFKLALAIVVLAVLGYSVYIWSERRQSEQGMDELNAASQTALRAASLEVKAAVESAEAQMQKTETQQVYLHSGLKFSFSFPKGMKVGNFQDAGGQTVIVQGADNKLGIQIYISDFDEDMDLTAERIKKDIPDMAVSQPSVVDVAGKKGISFFSQSDSLGQTYEVWLIRKEKLYQISGHAYQKGLVDTVLGTWKWEDENP